jgi:hypothetical protein
MWLSPPCIGKEYCIKCYHGIVSSVIIDFLQKFNGKNIGNDRQRHGERRNSGMIPESKLRAESARGSVIAASGLKERTGRSLLGQLIGEGLLVSDTPKGDVRLGLPMHAAGWFFPDLYPTSSREIEP